MALFFKGVVMKIVTWMCLFFISLSAHAERIIVTGEPVVLQQRDQVYYVPTTYVQQPSVTYMYVTIDGVHRVCFLNANPALVNVEATQINIEAQGKRVLWSCYAYNTTYFEARP
jgi:hypothetical protein